MDAMDVFSNIDSVFGTIKAATAVGSLALSGYSLFVCRDGVFIPWIDLNNMEKRLSLIKKIFNDLSDDQRQLINDLRNESDQTLDQLEERWQIVSMNFRYQMARHVESGVVTKILQVRKGGDAVDLKDEITRLQADVYETTSIPVREEKRKKKAEEERRAREEAEEREMAATLADVESNPEPCFPQGILPTLARPSIPRAIPLRAYFFELLPYIQCI